MIEGTIDNASEPSKFISDMLKDCTTENSRYKDLKLLSENPLDLVKHVKKSYTDEWLENISDVGDFSLLLKQYNQNLTVLLRADGDQMISEYVNKCYSALSEIEYLLSFIKINYVFKAESTGWLPQGYSVELREQPTAVQGKTKKSWTIYLPSDSTATTEGMEDCSTIKLTYEAPEAEVKAEQTVEINWIRPKLTVTDTTINYMVNNPIAETQLANLVTIGPVSEYDDKTLLTFIVEDLPAGISLDLNGKLYGTPTEKLSNWLGMKLTTDVTVKYPGAEDEEITITWAELQQNLPKTLKFTIHYNNYMYYWLSSGGYQDYGWAAWPKYEYILKLQDFNTSGNQVIYRSITETVIDPFADEPEVYETNGCTISFNFDTKTASFSGFATADCAGQRIREIPDLFEYDSSTKMLTIDSLDITTYFDDPTLSDTEFKECWENGADIQLQKLQECSLVPID